MQLKLPKRPHLRNNREWKRAFVPFGVVRLEEDNRHSLRLLVMSFPFTRRSVSRHLRLWTFKPDDCKRYGHEYR